MEVVSLCALPAYGFEWQPSQGVFALTVVCKATYRLRPGQSVLAAEQDPILRTDEHWNRDPAASLRASSDLAPYKRRADVVVVGHAYAPAQKPVRSFVARLVVGEIDKAVEVWCERAIRWRDGRLLEGPKIVKASLRWENAAGGPDSDNPVGLSFEGPLDAHGSLVVPCLQPPDTYLTTRGDTFAPIGFGPLAARWPARVRTLHRHAKRLLAEGWETRPLPSDFTYDFFSVAPPDQQQVSMLRPDERIILENLHPEHPRLVTSLPGIVPRAIADRATGEREEIALVADTLVIDTDRRICTLVWRGRMGLRHPGEAGRVAFWVDGGAVAAGPEPVRGAEPAASVGAESGSDTVMLFPQPADANTLPLPRIMNSAQPAPDASQTMAFSPAVAKDPLPFAPPPSGRAPEIAHPMSPWAREPPPVDNAGTGTLVGSLVPAARGLDAPTLPFVDREGRSSQPAPAEPGLFTPGTIPRPPSEPFRSSEDPTLSAPAEGGRAPGVGDHISDMGASGCRSPLAPIAPPPMIGPLAGSDVPVPSHSAPLPCVVGATLDTVVPAPLPSSAVVSPIQTLEEYSPERFAAISARVALRRVERNAILRDEGLSPEEWNLLQQHWLSAIREEAKRGRTHLLDRCDVAYVVQVEKERGPVTVEDYAKLVVAAERATVDNTLDELRLPRSAAIRIERIWLKRIADDPQLEGAVMEATFAERARQ